MNSTDLHIKYHMETGEWHQWQERSTGQFHDTDHYSREYAKWLEELVLGLLKQKNKNKLLNDLLEEVENELEEAYEKIEELEEEIETLHEKNAGADL